MVSAGELSLTFDKFQKFGNPQLETLTKKKMYLQNNERYFIKTFLDL